MPCVDCRRAFKMTCAVTPRRAKTSREMLIEVEVTTKEKKHRAKRFPNAIAARLETGRAFQNSSACFCTTHRRRRHALGMGLDLKGVPVALAFWYVSRVPMADPFVLCLPSQDHAIGASPAASLMLRSTSTFTLQTTLATAACQASDIYRCAPVTQMIWHNSLRSTHEQMSCKCASGASVSCFPTSG